ncbi:MAG: LytTR family transcriptional regulator DNA-binding domain-containing protein [Bacteroidota bacterium]
MRILYPLSESGEGTVVSNLVSDGIKDLNLSHAEIKYISFDDGLDVQNSLAAVVNVFDEETYRHSLNFIKNVSNKIPYLYISTTKDHFSWDHVKRFNPTKLLIAPKTVDEIQKVIEAFLLEISSSNNRVFKISDNSYIWLSPKRGVYQKLDFEAIKYIEAVDHYIKIHSDADSLPLIKASLRGFYSEHLEVKGHFYLLNRSCIINLLKVKKIANNQLFIDNNKPLAIPKGKREELLIQVGI